ncbi:MAG: M48 family metalloprotease [Armatimonadetes bacterium]|nr:M48 family metalloprotease [Armatimonadota bacterium]
MRTRHIWLTAAVLALATGAVGTARAADEARELEHQFGIVGRDTEEGRRFNDELDRVVGRMTRATGYELKSAILLGGRTEKNDKVINAFALPDGRIYVTLGLMRAIADAANPDAELAFVVGHEMTHVVEKHGRRQARKGTLAMILATILGSATRSQGAQDVLGAGAAAYVSHYSRKDEYAADRGGLLAMRRAGYPLAASVSMLERLQRKGEDSSGFINGLFGSHPLTRNRINRIKQLIADIQAGRISPDGDPKDSPRDRR